MDPDSGVVGVAVGTAAITVVRLGEIGGRKGFCRYASGISTKQQRFLNSSDQQRGELAMVVEATEEAAAAGAA